MTDLDLNIVKGLDPKIVLANYAESLATSLEGAEGVILGPTDTEVIVMALRHTAASI